MDAKGTSRAARNTYLNVDYNLINDLSGRILQDDVSNIIFNRKAQGQLYTFVGHDTLIAVQPSNSIQAQSGIYAKTNAKNVLPPHLFELANRVHRHLVYDDNDQTIIILGEAGSGKTVASEMILNHLLKLSDSSSRIKSAIIPMNVILEAFGGDTRPSRQFGCYQELQYTAGRISGLKLLSYNLNTSRLNYKIFYYLLADSTTEKSEWSFTSEKYAYLENFNTKDKSTLSSFDAKQFQILKDALKVMNIGKSKQNMLFRLLAGVLHLGNIEFATDEEAINLNESCTIKNKHELDTTADLFGVSSKNLEFALTCKTRLVKNDVYTAYLDVATARKERDALASTLYKLIFTYLVEKINMHLDADEFDRFIGIIDFPGIVSPSVKNLEEMLVNYSQEQLVDSFRKHALLDPAAGLSAEGIPIPTLKLIAPHPLASHILPIINSESKTHSPSDHNIIRNLASTASKTIVSGSNSFIIQHHSTINVDYQLGNFSIRNVASLSPDHVALFVGDKNAVPPSSNSIAKMLFSDPSIVVKSRNEDAVNEPMASVNTLKRRPTKHNRSKPLSTKTVADELVQGLNECLSILDASRPWFVVCIGAHDGLKSIDTQLSILGILELAEARAEGSYTSSIPFNDFIARYGSLLGITDENRPVRARCEELAAVLPNHSIFVGTTRIFLSEPIWSDWEKKLEANKPKVQYHNAEVPRDSVSSPAFSDQYDLELPEDNYSFQTSKKGKDLESQYAIPAVLPSQFCLDEKKNHIIEEDEAGVSASRRMWVCMTWFLTWWIPTFLLSRCGMKRQDIRMAWREKIALCIIIATMCACMLFFIIGLGLVICPRVAVMSPQELSSYTDLSNAWVSAYGRVYQINDLVKSHSSSFGVYNYQFSSYLGQDVSYLFYEVPLWSTYCPGILQPQSSWDNLASRSNTSYAHNGLDSNGQSKLYLEYMNRYVKYRLGYTKNYVSQTATQSKRWLVIYDNVYDVSTYFNAENHPFGKNGYAETIFDTYYGQDATAAWNAFRNVNATLANQQLSCMNHMWYIGTVDHRNDVVCQFSNYILLASTAFVMAIICFKFLAALQCGSRRYPEDPDKFVIIQVPCYTEGADSLARTFESVAATRYDDKRKLMFVICDGMIMGSGNDQPTPEIVLDLLGIDKSIQDPPAVAFESLGEGNQQLNYAKVYSGLYAFQGRSLPFVVVVKVGKPSERQKPGNRGKRDSQLVLMRFLSRVHFGSPLNPMEVEIYHHIRNIIGVNPSFYEFMLMVDADTEVYPDSLNRLVAVMQHDSRIMGLCGETLLMNEKNSIITMIQVYEYFISHHLAKQFESLFGSVTCLPGCFCMYRIRSPTKNVPLLISPDLVKDYSENRVETLHMKNLLYLGEDRYLTTLAMKHFPTMKLCFTPDAVCRTSAPESWGVLKSQRRRWINSTVHNLVELTSLNQLCGICCFSMRFIVYVDLVSTVLQPATIIYLAYLVYKVAFTDEAFPIMTIALIAAIYGLQLIILIMKQQWSQIIWLIIYICAIPIYTFYLPVYAFYHFDDFGWGSTRVVVGDNGKKTVYSSDVEPFDKSSIPLTKWTEMEKQIGLRAIELTNKNAKALERKSGTGSTDDLQTVYAPSSYCGSQYYLNGRPSTALPCAASYAGSVYSTVPNGQQVVIQPQEQCPIFGTAVINESLGSPSVVPPASYQLQPQAIVSRPSSIFAPRTRPSQVFDLPIPSSTSAAALPSIPILINKFDSGDNAVFPSNEIISREVHSILATCDLMTTSKKQVRKEASRRLGADLESHKSFINELIKDYLIKKEKQEE